MSLNPHRIVIVGGGAGGLELATRLGDKLGKRKRADITLIDETLTHLWKPLLHEVAAGTLDSHDDELDYLAQAHWHHFSFRLGRMDGLDRKQRLVFLAPTLDRQGKEITPRRSFSYDTLVIAVGSVSNDFGIPGVKERCFFLDNREQADYFQDILLSGYIQAQTQNEALLRAGQLTVAIVGAGATGVELAAELRNAARQLVAYGLDRINPERDVKLVIVQAMERILPELPPALSQSVQAQLEKMKVQIHTNERVVKVAEEGLYTASGLFIPAGITVWAAGIKAPDFLRGLDGLDTNHLNQLVVRQTLQATRDDNIFGFGDCAACPRPNTNSPVPPRAQAAHQQASMLVKSLTNRIKGKSLPVYVYRDYGSLISLGAYSTIGNLMGSIIGNVTISGLFARFMYISLYKLHQRALHGILRVALITLANMLTRPTRPRLKLH
jgi:NADH:ubiquinone reductase (H+-translocating)